MSGLDRAQDGVTIFLGVVIEATPFLLLGVLMSQALALVLHSDRLLAWLPRGRLASLAALGGLGAPWPTRAADGTGSDRRRRPRRSP